MLEIDGLREIDLDLGRGISLLAMTSRCCSFLSVGLLTMNGSSSGLSSRHVELSVTRHMTHERCADDVNGDVNSIFTGTRACRNSVVEYCGKM